MAKIAFNNRLCNYMHCTTPHILKIFNVLIPTCSSVSVVSLWTIQWCRGYCPVAIISRTLGPLALAQGSLKTTVSIEWPYNWTALIISVSSLKLILSSKKGEQNLLHLGIKSSFSVDIYSTYCSCLHQIHRCSRPSHHIDIFCQYTSTGWNTRTGWADSWQLFDLITIE